MGGDGGDARAQRALLTFAADSQLPPNAVGDAYVQLSTKSADAPDNAIEERGDATTPTMRGSRHHQRVLLPMALPTPPALAVVECAGDDRPLSC